MNRKNILIVHLTGRVEEFCVALEAAVKNEYALSLSKKFFSMEKFKEEMKSFPWGKFTGFILFGTEKSVKNHQHQIMNVLRKTCRNQYKTVFLTAPKTSYEERMNEVITFLRELSDKK